MGNVEDEWNCSVALFYTNIYMSVDNLLSNVMFDQNLMKLTLFIYLETIMLSTKIKDWRSVIDLMSFKSETKTHIKVMRLFIIK